MKAMKTAKKKPKKPEVWKGGTELLGGDWRVRIWKGDWRMLNYDGFASADSARRSAESLAKRLGITIKWEKA